MNNRIVYVIISALMVFLYPGCSDIPGYKDNRHKPSVSIINIKNQDILNNPVVVTGRSIDRSGISLVKVIVDGTEYNAQPDPEWDSWRFDLAAVSLSTGEHRIEAVAVNSYGFEGSTAVIFYYRDGIDLVPVKVDVTGVVTDRQTLAVSGTVKVDVANNSLYNLSSGYRVLLFEDLNGNGIFDASADRMLGQAEVGAGHAPHVTNTYVIGIGPSVSFADNLVYAFIDSSQSVMETDETNNTISNMTGSEYRPPVGQFNPEIKWHWTGSTVNPASNQVLCLPIVAPMVDDNGDGLIDGRDIPYIIFNTYINTDYNANGTLRVVRGDGKGELFSVTSHDTHPISNPAVADIDRDGRPDILVIEETGKLMAINNDGSLKWISTASLPPSPWKSVTIADLDEDGTPEIIIGPYVFRNDGSLIWNWTAGNMGSFTSCVAKLLPGEHPCVISGNTAYRYDGTVLWQKTAEFSGFTAVGDLNLDGFPEVVIVCSQRAWLLGADGTIIWGPVTLTTQGGGAPTIADVDGDGLPEIGIACADSFVVLNNDGTILWSSATQDHTSQVTGSSVFDFEGDGAAELVYADELYLRIYKGSDGTVLFGMPVGSGTGLELPVIVDVDNDNKSEIVVVSNNLLNIFYPTTYPVSLGGVAVIGDANDTWVNTGKIWNQHAYHITNINDDASVPQYETDNWNVYNNYRQNQMQNPFGAFDISASYLRIDNSGLPGSVTLTARIGNSGALAIASGFFVSFYDGNPASGGTLIGTYEVTDRLDPGAYADVTVIMNSPAAGSHNIYVAADDDGAGNSRLREVDELNNSTHGPVQF